MQLSLKVVFSTICIFIIAVAWQWGMANVYYFKASNTMNEVALEVNSNSSGTKLKHNIDSMLALHPQHAHYLTTAGVFYEKLAFVTNDENEKRHYLEQALAKYKQAAAVRAWWPRTWADIFRVKALLNEFDAEFSHAVTMANTYGSKDEYVANELIFLLLKNWRQFSASDVAIAIKQLNNLTDYARFKKIYSYALLLDEKPFFCKLVQVNNIQTKFGGCKA